MDSWGGFIPSNNSKRIRFIANKVMYIGIEGIWHRWIWGWCDVSEKRCHPSHLTRILFLIYKHKVLRIFIDLRGTHNSMSDHHSFKRMDSWWCSSFDISGLIRTGAGVELLFARTWDTSKHQRNLARIGWGRSWLESYLPSLARHWWILPEWSYRH